MLKKLFIKGDSAKNILTLMAGTSIAQAIPIAISPILSRLYSPSEFGVVALYMSLATIIGAIATANYEFSIMLPIKEEDAINIVFLGIFLSFFISVLLFIIIFLFNNNICNLLNNHEISLWLYFLPISVFFLGLFNNLQYFSNRKKYYKDLAKANIYKSSALGVVSVFFGIFKIGAGGLILGQISSSVVANTKLFINVIKNNSIKEVIKIKKINYLAKRYKDFPLFSLPANLLNISTYQFSNILISSFFSVTTLGFYSFVQRILGIPSMLIGKSVGQVFFQESTQELLETGKANVSFIRTLKRLVIIAIPVFILLFFVVEDLFRLAFGEEWIIAGKYAKILVPMYGIRFVSSPLSILLSVFEKQRQGLLINVILFSSSIGVLIFGNNYNFEFTKLLYIFSFLLSVEYLLFIIYYMKLVKYSFKF